MNEPEKECTEGMGELVQELAFLQGTRKSIEDGMNSMEQVIKLKAEGTDLKQVFRIAMSDARQKDMMET